MKTLSQSAVFIIGCLFTLVVVSQVSFKKVNNNDKQLFVAPEIPKELSFAGEKAPIDRWDVREKFDKEFLLNYYSPGTILYLIKLSNRTFPIISERLKANGVPDDFKYLCIAESNMQSWALSKAGAVGYWQFMNSTGSGYGLEISSSVDERQNLEKSTDAACKYLKAAYQQFGNWTAAAASYDCGKGAYSSAAAFQKTNNYYDLMLPEEANKYVYRILSFKYLIENAKQLGFIVPDDEKYGNIQSKTVTITSSITDLAQYAIDNGTTYKILKLLNPWIKGKSLNVNPGKSYTMKLPLNNSNMVSE